MIGSAGIGSLIALLGFWILIGYGVIAGELRPRAAAIFVALWAAGYIASPYVMNGLLFTSYVAILDVVLILVIFKRDVRLT